MKDHNLPAGQCSKVRALGEAEKNLLLNPASSGFPEAERVSRERVLCPPADNSGRRAWLPLLP